MVHSSGHAHGADGALHDRGPRNAATDFMPLPSVIRQGVCKAGTYNIDDKLPFPTTGDASNFLGRITLRLQGTIT